MELAEHQILIAAAREEAYNRGYRDGLTVRDAAFELVQRESFVNGLRVGLEQGKLERDAMWVSGLRVLRA